MGQSPAVQQGAADLTRNDCAAVEDQSSRCSSRGRRMLCEATPLTRGWSWRPRAAPWPDPRRSAFTFNARAALYLGVRLLGLRPGDAVLVPAYCCGAELGSLLHAGLRQVFYRVGPDLVPDLEHLDRQRDPSTRAILVIHYFGRPQPMQPLRELARRRGLLDRGLRARLVRPGRRRPTRRRPGRSRRVQPAQASAGAGRRNDAGRRPSRRQTGTLPTVDTVASGAEIRGRPGGPGARASLAGRHRSAAPAQRRRALCATAGRARPRFLRRGALRAAKRRLADVASGALSDGDMQEIGDLVGQWRGGRGAESPTVSPNAASTSAVSGYSE
jgi:hypothetical protein